MSANVLGAYRYLMACYMALEAHYGKGRNIHPGVAMDAWLNPFCLAISLNIGMLDLLLQIVLGRGEVYAYPLWALVVGAVCIVAINDYIAKRVIGLETLRDLIESSTEDARRRMRIFALTHLFGSLVAGIGVGVGVYFFLRGGL